MVRLVTDKESNKPRGYVFIEYMHTRDMKVAYKQADGKKLDNRRVLVDVERGKTVPNWHPRRLGGGLGTIRVGREDVNQKYSGRSATNSLQLSINNSNTNRSAACINSRSAASTKYNQSQNIDSRRTAATNTLTSASPTYQQPQYHATKRPENQDDPIEVGCNTATKQRTTDTQTTIGQCQAKLCNWSQNPLNQATPIAKDFKTLCSRNPPYNAKQPLLSIADQCTPLCNT
ncbi:U1 small nuclear ribonucleoprotein 70 kDa [Camellia lanceoleosa]|uniref:U1 small nuclear ribonucleoprotein 70 kDa n=1 Tax=Camellia lanceoleosa TaxID=1840588 RepID=A0ACC0FA98_9ERIC|nr:U1 small nuclear ribonucleoprotein 70 kDa [Camellia lanceoleosa]